MRSILQKTFELKAPGGNVYEWKIVKTKFEAPSHGIFTIKIVASANDKKRNQSTDDDDLRVVLDDFDFGKYEIHDEKVSWKGFGTSASWDGTSLKGGTKTIYFFVSLSRGEHVLRFFADNTPTLKSLEIFEIKNNKFELKNLKPPENIKNKSEGIPWLSFVFLGTYTKTFVLGVDAKSAKEKSVTDGDNLKVVINGAILNNKQARNSRKYKNFYFSGDLKAFDVLSITNEALSDPIAFENAIELWYDEQPIITGLSILFFDNQEFLKSFKSAMDLRKHIVHRVYATIAYFKLINKSYSAQFIRHAMKDNPSSLIFRTNNSIVEKIKKDPTYGKIMKKMGEKILNGVLSGEIWPYDFADDEKMKGQINFNTPELATSLHGIKKIEYEAKLKQIGQYKVELILFDIYDFQQEDVPSFFVAPWLFVKNKIINKLNMGEDMEIIHNFEIQIYITQMIYVSGS